VTKVVRKDKRGALSLPRRPSDTIRVTIKRWTGSDATSASSVFEENDIDKDLDFTLECRHRKQSSSCDEVVKM
jgi:hypothetical protein